MTELPTLPLTLNKVAKAAEGKEQESDGSLEMSLESAQHMDESRKNPNVVSLLGHDPFAQDEVTLKQKKELESYVKDLTKV